MTTDKRHVGDRVNRRDFFKYAAGVPFAFAGCAQLSPKHENAPHSVYAASRVRPGDRGWPSTASWEDLRRRVGGRLIRPESPLAAGHAADADRSELVRQLKNPYFIGDHPALTQTCGWADAWSSAPSVFAVAAEKTEDVVAAVNFARENRLRLVVKSGGHSYQGTSNSADSLLIWTRAMDEIELHDAFVGQGCGSNSAPQSAVTVGAGAIWMHTYGAVTTHGGRYVQGGGCTTVGVAGLVQSGGFGSFSKGYGTSAAALLEAEIVTADGQVRIVNECQDSDLFWALKGGGGGSFGVVTKLTLRTWDLPNFFGGVFGTIRARSEAAFRGLVTRIVSFYSQHLFNPHWGEQIVFGPDRTVRIAMVFQGLNRREAGDIWKPLVDWIASAPRDFAFESPPRILDLPARHFWDASYLQRHHPEFVVLDERPGAPAGNLFWVGDQGESGQFIHAYQSAWLPASLLAASRQHTLVDALLASSRHWSVSLHFNKGLAGARGNVLTPARNTATNPAVLDAFALAIIASNGPPAFAGTPGFGPDLNLARRNAAAVAAAMAALLQVAPDAGSYVAESDFFERGWQRSFWGANYPRLAAVKKKYDPTGLFFVRHGVGSEEWTDDGFDRIS